MLLVMTYKDRNILAVWFAWIVTFNTILALGWTQIRKETKMLSFCNMKFFCGLSALGNGIFHTLFCLRLFNTGENLEYPPESAYKDLSFFSVPLSDPGLQIKILLAISIAIIWIIWGYWVTTNNTRLADTKWEIFLSCYIFNSWMDQSQRVSFFFQ